jgi:uncharacterized membrane protein
VPARILTYATLVLACFGLFIAGTLSLSHATGVILPCGGSDECDIVTNSIYSELFGIPVAYFGVASYAALLLLAIWPSRPRDTIHIAFSVSALGMILSGLLIYVAETELHATCKWCVASAVTMTLIFVIQALRLRWKDGVLPVSLRLSAVPLVIVAASGAGYIAWNSKRPLIDMSVLRKTDMSEVAPALSAGYGDLKSPIVIVEFADFACPACRDEYGNLERLHKDFDGWRLVFRHFPQAQIHGHEASMEGAILGEVAHEKGKFWDYAGKAFATPKHPTVDDYRGVLRGLGIDPGSPTAAASARVDADLALGKKLALRTTPFFIVYSPDLPPVVCTNIDLGDVLVKPDIVKYLRHK